MWDGCPIVRRTGSLTESASQVHSDQRIFRLMAGMMTMTSAATRAVVEETIPDSAGAASQPTNALPFDFKAARERVGISLASIAAYTKIPLSFLEELERGDLRQFPRGIYARARVRAYAEAAHLPVDAVFAAIADCLPAEESLEQIRYAKDAGERHEAGYGGGVLQATGSALLFAIVIVVWAVGPRVSSLGAERDPSRTPMPAPPSAAPRVADTPLVLADAGPQMRHDEVGGSEPRPTITSSRRPELPRLRPADGHGDAPPASHADVGAARVASAPDPLPATSIALPLIAMPEAGLNTTAVSRVEQRPPKLAQGFKKIGRGLWGVVGSSGSSK